MAEDHKSQPSSRSPSAAAPARPDTEYVAGEAETVFAAPLTHLCDTFLADDNEAHHRAVSEMMRSGLGPAEIIDRIIPELARMMGRRWADDDLSFVEVTIGSARLQEAVRALAARQHAMSGEEETAIGTADFADEEGVTPKVLMIIPRSEEHTLGAFVAADQFRRFGYSVEMAVDNNKKQIVSAVSRRVFSLVGITISGLRSLASTIELVEIIRSTTVQDAPIVLGGSLLEFEEDLKATTGVDHIAKTVRDALELCGLDIVELDPPHIKLPNHVLTD